MSASGLERKGHNLRRARTRAERVRGSVQGEPRFGARAAAHDIAEDTAGDEKPLIAFYVGDFGPSGLYMSEVDLPQRLEKYARPRVSSCAGSRSSSTTSCRSPICHFRHPTKRKIRATPGTADTPARHGAGKWTR